VRKTGTPEEREGMKNFWPGAGRKRNGDGMLPEKRTLLPVGNQKAGWLQTYSRSNKRSGERKGRADKKRCEGKEKENNSTSLLKV
jgi:hypothetical protein